MLFSGLGSLGAGIGEGDKRMLGIANTMASVFNRYSCAIFPPHMRVATDCSILSRLVGQRVTTCHDHSIHQLSDHNLLDIDSMAMADDSTLETNHVAISLSYEALSEHVLGGFRQIGNCMCIC